MEDFLGSLFCLYIVWIVCKNCSLCDYSYHKDILCGQKVVV